MADRSASSSAPRWHGAPPASVLPAPPQPAGGAIVMSAQRGAVAADASQASAARTDDALAALRARLAAAASGSASSGASASGASEEGSGAAVVGGAAAAPPAAGASAPLDPVAAAAAAAEALRALQARQDMAKASGAVGLATTGVLPAGAAAQPSGASAAAALAAGSSGGLSMAAAMAVAASLFQSGDKAGAAAAASTGAQLPPPTAAASPSDAAALASVASLMLALSSGAPLLGTSSTTPSLPMPNGLSGNVTLGPYPASAAGLLGPLGLPSYLAGVVPTRVLVLHNALVDADVRDLGRLADIRADIVLEATAAAAAVGGGAGGGSPLVGAVIPLPRQRPGGARGANGQPPAKRRRVDGSDPSDDIYGDDGWEPVDVRFTRPVRLTRPGQRLPGGVLLLEDSRAPDRSKVMTTNANSFFAKVLGKDGSKAPALAQALMLTNGPGSDASLFGAAGSSYGAAPAPTPAEATSASRSSSGSSSGGVTVETLGAGHRDEEEEEGEVVDTLSSSSSSSASGSAEAPSAAASASSSSEPVGDKGDDYDPLAGRTLGLGKVFLEFSTVAGAVAAQKELSGRAFDGRILVTSFADEAAYKAGHVADFSHCFTG